jgi:hypothetical protein
MTMAHPPLHHMVRVRRSEDLTFIRPGLMDEVIINANHLENSLESTATALRETTLPYSIDPVLTRFQVPEWWKNDKGETKRNYARLGAAYVKGTSIEIAAGPLLKTVPSDKEWSILARNVIEYQRDRLIQIRPQMDLFRPELKPARLMAPALVAFTDAEDRINRLLAAAGADAAGEPVALPIVVPDNRLRNAAEIRRLLDSVPTEGISSYFLWTPRVTEELLLSDRALLGGVLQVVSTLAERGIPLGHMHATYVIAALHDLGMSAVIHHMGWIDKGEPADERRGGLRSCQIYVPGVRHCVAFDRAHVLGRSLDVTAYTERFCNCTFCSGSFAVRQHPLDLLLEDRAVPIRNRPDRLTPTGRAVALNTWHYLLSRRAEIEAFSGQPAVDVLASDIERAAALAGGRESDRLRRLADELRSA